MQESPASPKASGASDMRSLGLDAWSEGLAFKPPE